MVFRNGVPQGDVIGPFIFPKISLSVIKEQHLLSGRHVRYLNVLKPHFQLCKTTAVCLFNPMTACQSYLTIPFVPGGPFFYCVALKNH